MKLIKPTYHNDRTEKCFTKVRLSLKFLQRLGALLNYRFRIPGNALFLSQGSGWYAIYTNKGGNYHSVHQAVAFLNTKIAQMNEIEIPKHPSNHMLPVKHIVVHGHKKPQIIDRAYQAAAGKRDEEIAHYMQHIYGAPAVTPIQIQVQPSVQPTKKVASLERLALLARVVNSRKPEAHLSH